MKNTLFKKKILVTAGPTREYIDPVRYISNESSGKMGYAIAEALHQMGADVVLVSGPVTINTSFPQKKIVKVINGAEMFTVCHKYFNAIDIAIFCAAVADYTPKITSKIKIKKVENNTSLELQKNKDIAYEFGKIKRNNQISVGFALETNSIHENAIEKLKRKNFDLIVLNSPNENEGFGYDTNKVTIIDSALSFHSFPLKLKKEIANDIIFFIRNSDKLASSENVPEHIGV